MKASLFLQWYPFSNNILRLRLYSEVFHQINAFGNEKWNHIGHSFIPSINLAYKKWGVSVFYQTGKEISCRSDNENNSKYGKRSRFV